jgi:ribonuclease HI
LSCVEIFVDGASRGNPGHAGIGIIIYDNTGKKVKAISQYIGKTTNNIAEYKALITALEAVEPLKPEFVKVYMDSELVVKQINGEYKVKSKNLKPLYQTVKAYIKSFEGFALEHINRGKNTEADLLANKGIDNALKNP